VAEKVGQNSKEVLTLNKPTTLEDLAKGKKVSEKQTDVRTKYDPVSILRPYQKGSDAIEIESTTWNPLAEHKTDTLKRLDEDVMIGRGKLGMMMRGGADAEDDVLDLIEGMTALRDRAEELTQEHLNNPNDQGVWSDLLTVFREAIRLQNTALYRQELAGNVELNAIANAFNNMLNRVWLADDDDDDDNMEGGAFDEESTDSTEGANVEESTDATEGSISSKGSISASSVDDDNDNDNDMKMMKGMMILNV
jgi:hypothetical protein